MSYAGHVFDMINRIQQNRASGELRKQKRAELRKQYAGKVSRQAGKNGKTLSREELEKIKQDIRAKLRKERKRNILITIVSAIIALVLATGIVWAFGKLVLGLLSGE